MSFSLVNSRKRVKAIDLKLCIICQIGDSSTLVKRPKEGSIHKLLNATDRRQDEVTERVRPYILTNDIRSFTWHRDCYSTYTSENNITHRESQLAKLLLDNNDEESYNESASCSNTTVTTRSIISKTNMSKCIFCQKETKKKVSTLFRISEIAFASKLLNTCRERQDCIFTRLSTCSTVNDIFAADVMYHKLCEREYFRQSTFSIDNDTTVQHSDTTLKDQFKVLISEIDSDLGQKCYSLSYLTLRLQQLCPDCSVNIDNRLLKRLLIEHYGESILFSHPKDKSKSAMVFKIDISIEEVVDQVRVSKYESVDKYISSLRDEIKTFSFSLKNNICDEKQLKEELENFKIPKLWDNLLNKISRSTNQISNQTERKLKSVFMDLYHVSHNGGLTPKHVALAESVHHLTRSKHLITLLNRLGHSISYKQLTNIDDNIVAYNLSLSKDGLVPLPSNIVKDKELFVHGAIDNDDFNEETLDGKSTTHITAMVLYQTAKDTIVYPRHRPIPIAEVCNSIADKKQCTLPCQEVIKFVPNCSIDDASSKLNIPKDRRTPSKLNYENFKMCDFIWNLCRVNHPIHEDSILQNQSLCPSWTPFNQAISKSVMPLTTVGFCTMIPAPPTTPDAVYTAMRNFLNLNEQIGQEYSVLTCDMAIYLIAKKIQMQSIKFSKLILRIGTFHLAKNWLVVIGQFMCGSGLADIFVETGVYGENTIKALLRGTQYNRGIRAHKLMYEALRKLQLTEFVNEVGVNSYKNIVTTIHNLQNALSNDLSNAGVFYDLLFEECEDFYNKFQVFLNDKCETNETFKFWTHYCDLVEILLNCIRSDRDGNWDLHIMTVEKMLPYFFSYNHINYIRGCFLYLYDMQFIPVKVKSAFEQGHFSVKRRNGKFNNVATDHALEQTLIRSSKVQGGVIGITANASALQKWILLYPNKASITDVLYSFCDATVDPTGDGEEYSHNEWGTNRRKRDEKDVNKLVDFLQDHDNPFKGSDERLRNIVSGLLADEEVSEFLLNVEKKGQELYDKFKSERLVEKSKSVFSPLKRNSVKSLSTMCITKVPSQIKKQISIQDKDLTFIFFLAAQRSYGIEKLVTHELCTYPPALATSDNLLKKSTKSQLIKEIELETNCINNELDQSCSEIHIFDGMALFRSTPTTLLKDFVTLKDYGDFILGRIFKVLKSCNTVQVDLVFDTYKKSAKQSEQLRRQGSKEPLKYSINGINTKFPKQWTRFLCVSENKNQLITVISAYILDTIVVPAGKVFVISGGFKDSTRSIRKNCDGSTCEVARLNCNHVEADTRMFFNAREDLKLQHTETSIVIHSPDTDVFVIGIRCWNELEKLQCSSLWILTAHASKKKYFGCHIASKVYGEEISRIIPAVHAFSGCDSTSKIGTKKSALHEAKSRSNIDILEKLGKHLNEEDFKQFEKLYLKIIKKPGETCDESRFKLISSNVGALKNISTLPATSDSLQLHVLRSSAQAYFWNNVFEANHNLNLNDYGFYEENNAFRPVLMRKPPYPSDLVPPCKCKKCTKSCPCGTKDVSCCSYCKCYDNDCRNTCN